MNEIRGEILKKLIHQPRLSYSQLWDKKIGSNRFNYHLKVLEEDGLIEKKGKYYGLTDGGKKLVTYLDGETALKRTQPLLVTLIAVIKGDKILLQQRRKEPFYGYWGLQGGKIRFNQYPLEAAKEELLEETGLSGELEFKGMMLSKTFQGEEQLHNHYLHVFLCRNPKGKLVSRTREGVNKWVGLKDYKKLRIFPDLPKLIKIARGRDFAVLEIDRLQEEGKFAGFGGVNWKEF